MAETPDGPSSSARSQLTPSPLPAEIEKAATEAMEKLASQDPRSLLSIFLAKNTTSFFGPDPETSKILAQSEIHQEDCRLKGYQATLQNRDQQNQRDHEYRMKRLGHETAMQIIVLLMAVAGAGVGLYLVVSGHLAIGSNVLVASVMTVLYVLGGKSPLLRGKE